MRSEHEFKLTRREALLNGIIGTVAIAVSAPIVESAPATDAQQFEPEYVPENDYPFFGGKLPSAYISDS